MKKKPSALQGRHKNNNPENNLSERITFRLSPAERNVLEKKAAQRGLKLSLLCRLIIMRRKIPDHSPETRQWLRDLVGIKNNLNQIAQYVNTKKEADNWAMDAIRFLASEADNAKQILTNPEHEQSI